MRRTPYADRYRLYPNTNSFLKQPENVEKNDHMKLLTPRIESPSPSLHKFDTNEIKHGLKRSFTISKASSEMKNQKFSIQRVRDPWISLGRESRKNSSNESENSRGSKIKRNFSLKVEDRNIQYARNEFRDAIKLGQGLRNRNSLSLQKGYLQASTKDRVSDFSSYQAKIEKLIKEPQEKTEIKQDIETDKFYEYVMRFSYRTKKGIIPSNPKKVNQDSFIINPNIQDKTFQHLFGICDGHGPLGHHVSNFIKVHLPLEIVAIRNLQKSPQENLTKAFGLTYNKLIRESNIDLDFSGSTVISTYLFQNRLYCCNVGDSRAISGRFNHQNSKWSSIQLSNDHKPDLPEEHARIIKMNGRVDSFRDELGEKLGPSRVWLKRENLPGLAMSRSFGDLVAASVGVIPTPEITEYELGNEDRILLIGSDGVFEFLSNEKIMEEIGQFYVLKEIQKASDHLLKLAEQSWKRNSNIIDDITFVLIFLHYDE